MSTLLVLAVVAQVSSSTTSTATATTTLSAAPTATVAIAIPSPATATVAPESPVLNGYSKVIALTVAGRHSSLPMLTKDEGTLELSFRIHPFGEVLDDDAPRSFQAYLQ